MYRLILPFICIFLICSCSVQGANRHVEAEPVLVERFDKALFGLVNSGDEDLQRQLQEAYPQMLDIIGKAVLNIQNSEQSAFWDRLINYYSEPTLNSLYRDALQIYNSIEDVEKELGCGFSYLKDQFSELVIPTVYMHVSGFNQNVLVGDGLLSISIDKYLGEDYPLYSDFFYPYQRRKMQRSYIVPDYLTGWLMTELAFAGKENVLLERMIYDGKIKYLLLQALPDRSPAELLGMTEAEYNWCEQHEALLWKAVIERKHLYTPDMLTTEGYFSDAPSLFLADEAPGNIGGWLGLKIVGLYMKQSGASPAELIQNNEAQDILTVSKYRPR